jgi:hypothetical protein
LYRIRQKDGSGLDYIGQTGRSLRGRLGMLDGVYRAIMPYNDPHTAGPALWALRHRDGCDFEASVTEVSGDDPWRKALEVTAITIYRLQTGRSPSFNFGRMPAGYRKSTGNNKRLVESGLRARGGLDQSAPLKEESVPVSGDLASDPQAPDWMGWDWSPWLPIADACKTATGTGLYRIGAGGTSGLTYIGQGLIASRLTAHMAKGLKHDHRQADYFSEALVASWVDIQTAPFVHRLEHENDLIAAHVLTTGWQPEAQFLG